MRETLLSRGMCYNPGDMEKRPKLAELERYRPAAIRHLREKFGDTQAELGAKINKSGKSISKVETGYAPASYYFLIAFLDVYGLGWAEFEEVLLQLRSLNNVTDQPNSRPYGTGSVPGLPTGRR